LVFSVDFIRFSIKIRFINADIGYKYKENNDFMIEYIKGEVDTLTPTCVVLENQGVGYFVNISLNTYTEIQFLKNCKLYIYEAIREDAYILFGFSKLSERTVFQQLIGVSGVGANTARMILSSLTVSELEACIMSENSDVLKGVKGIGLKTAQRIIIDLKDKINKSGMDTAKEGTLHTSNNQVREEAVVALQMLGFAQSLSVKTVNKILFDSPGIPVEQVIKAALKLL
jgi:holliday junction DNA helicase RuvA